MSTKGGTGMLTVRNLSKSGAMGRFSLEISLSLTFVFPGAPGDEPEANASPRRLPAPSKSPEHLPEVRLERRST
jgi:hypothetical protein